MKTAKTIIVENGKLVKKEKTITPLLESEYLFKPERVLTTPLDMLLFHGLLNTYPPVIGTFAKGMILEPKEPTDPVEAYVHPIDCDSFPVIKREGYASTLTSLPKKYAKHVKEELSYPEFYYIYQLVYTALNKMKGATLVIGGSGLQTKMLAYFSDKNTVFTGTTNKSIGRSKARIIGEEKIVDTSWDTVIVWTINLEKTEKILKDIHSEYIWIHPFTACLYNKLEIVPGRHKVVNILYPEKTYEIDRRIETIVQNSKEHIIVKYDEVGPILDYKYMTIIMKE